MRKEIAPELYNYNKFPGPEFHLHGDKVETEGIAFSLVENIKDAFDVTAFNQRFSEVLTKFDYIVGDWSNEQLRLRGFYKDDRTEEKLCKKGKEPAQTKRKPNADKKNRRRQKDQHSQKEDKGQRHFVIRQK